MVSGIPQGLPISALLANIYMLPFDEVIIEELAIKKNVFYRRYSDDIIVVCEKNQVKEIEDFILREIKKIELVISKGKTEKFLFTNASRLQCYKYVNKEWIENIPLTYLGFEFYGYQTLIKSKNLASFYRDMKDTIRRKSNRVSSIKSKYLVDEAPLYKGKIYRLYSHKGIKKRVLKKGNRKREYRGNYIKYAYRASEEMEAPEIKRQLRRHWKILRSTLRKYDFSNVSNSEETTN